jgi:cytoskeleton protein RodZ
MAVGRPADARLRIIVEEKQVEISGALAEQPQPLAEVEPSLGKSLLLAREGRKLTREQAAIEARLPVHYVRMMEGGDYSLISDQLYLLPFIRRYAAFLGLDAEETAMRFVGEVQRSDNNAPKLSEPIAVEHKKRGRGTWAKVVVIVLVIAAGWLYLVNVERHRDATDDPAAQPSAVASPAALSSPAAKPLFSITPASPAPAATEPPVAATAKQAANPPRAADTVTR